MKNYAVICLDETGSMTGQEERVVTSLNEYVAQLPTDTHITVFKFDSARWTEFFDGVQNDWKKMVKADYKPGAMTPLYDSIAKSITHATTITEDGDKVMIMIDTDGFENASQEHTHESIKAMVDQKKESGWDFLFMASGIDEAQAIEVSNVGQSLGTQTMASAYADKQQLYTMAASHTVNYFDDSVVEKSWKVSKKSK